MVYRVYVEKKPGLTGEADALAADIRSLLHISGLTGLRLLHRYDAEGLDGDLMESCKQTVFSEPQLDTITEELPLGKEAPAAVFAVEYLPGQFDQRADSAAQCIQLLSQKQRPVIRTAKVYILNGRLSEEEIAAIKHHVINPVECREASLELPASLQVRYAMPDTVETLEGFCALEDDQAAEYVQRMGLAMDADDLRFCRDYFRGEKRDPTITELRMIDTYWSDHCRHTTFLTTLDRVTFEDPQMEATYRDYLEARRDCGREAKPVTLMDAATAAMRWLKKQGKLPNLDESEEINACTVKMKITVDGKEEPWLLLFKNETHNHPTEIEPFGGAATCIGGAIRDPLSGRSYVYAAMRVTGAADPLRPLSETLPGKLPQRKLVTTAAAGYSSYGNQIGLATGQVDEIYHDGYMAKRMEIGAVLGAAPEKNVRRECPAPGDIVLLLGGRTGRDGCGGATGSSKKHTAQSLSVCGAEVQKGNAPEERKLQRLFRQEAATRMIKRCNDFGAGGVSVAIGELADGLEIDLDAVPRKYDGLDGTELAISESQERMAVVVAPGDVENFRRMADAENIESAVVAVVTETPRLRMKWKGKILVDISREFLNSNGAEKHMEVIASKGEYLPRKIPSDFAKGYLDLASDLNVCSKRGLSERFDSTIGAGTVLMPFGGSRQLTPTQAMVMKIPVEHGKSDACSYMAWGYNPMIAEGSPYHASYLAVVESVSKLIAAGASSEEVYLTFQEYFEKPGRDSRRWGKPLAALLGAFRAQKELGIASIGGKDSMSGSFEQLDVPPTLVSFAVAPGSTWEVISPEFKRAGDTVVLLTPQYGEDHLPTAASLRSLWNKVTTLMRNRQVAAAWTPGFGGCAEGVMKMAFGNHFGFVFDDVLSEQTLFDYCYGGMILELYSPCDPDALLAGSDWKRIGRTAENPIFLYRQQQILTDTLRRAWEDRLEPVYACNIATQQTDIPAFYSPASGPRAVPKIGCASPRVLIPVFPGTNCEYDTARAFEAAGAQPEIFVIRNRSAADVAESIDAFAASIRRSQIICIPGGFSGGDEPDGSGKFINAFFRNASVKDAVTGLLEHRDGLMCGICNGFQALIKLGLVPFGRITDPTPDAPTLTFNTIGRHQSRLVRTRVASNRSPWLALTQTNEIYTVPISHGEGRFYASEAWIAELAKNGQIATQYVDAQGIPTGDVRCNPNNAAFAVEGITSPDGRVFGKMGHSERIGADLYRNVPGRYDMGIFASAVAYYKV